MDGPPILKRGLQDCSANLVSRHMPRHLSGFTPEPYNWGLIFQTLMGDYTTRTGKIHVFFAMREQIYSKWEYKQSASSDFKFKALALRTTRSDLLFYFSSANIWLKEPKNSFYTAGAGNVITSLRMERIIWRLAVQWSRQAPGNSRLHPNPKNPSWVKNEQNFSTFHQRYLLLLLSPPFQLR